MVSNGFSAALSSRTPVGANALQLLEHILHGRITEIAEELAAMRSQDRLQRQGPSPCQLGGSKMDGWAAFSRSIQIIPPKPKPRLIRQH